jgi:hypothetical protein
MGALEVTSVTSLLCKNAAAEKIIWKKKYV